MTDEQKECKKKGESRNCIIYGIFASFAANEDRTNVTCVMLFGIGTAQVDDQITPKEVKMEKDKIRYFCRCHQRSLSLEVTSAPVPLESGTRGVN